MKTLTCQLARVSFVQTKGNQNIFFIRYLTEYYYNKELAWYCLGGSIDLDNQKRARSKESRLLVSSEPGSHWHYNAIFCLSVRRNYIILKTSKWKWRSNRYLPWISRHHFVGTLKFPKETATSNKVGLTATIPLQASYTKVRSVVIERSTFL